MTRDAVGTLRVSLTNTVTNWRPALLVFLPFVAGYYLSYLFRTVNALISARLVSDLGLGAADLGFLTSVYFLSFAAMQLPLGILLDRYGPRRVQSILLLVAAVGAALFGAAEGFWLLLLARALIGLGVAGALVAGLKAIVLWFPKERMPLVNGCFIMLGALGAISATIPAEVIASWLGWRGLFELLALLTAGSAIAIFLLVPDRPRASQNPTSDAGVNLRAIYADPRFWQLAPLSATCIGTAWALQGLWAAPWLADVEKFDYPFIVRHLFVMAAALSTGALVLGIIADRLRRRGVRPDSVLAVVATIFIFVQAALVLRFPFSTYLTWAVVGCVGASTVLSFTMLAEYFPAEAAGRANGALNLLHIGGAFILQYSIGLIIERWANVAGHYPPIAYKTAFAFAALLQITALIWFLCNKEWVPNAMSAFVRSALRSRLWAAHQPMTESADAALDPAKYPGVGVSPMVGTAYIAADPARNRSPMSARE